MLNSKSIGVGGVMVAAVTAWLLAGHVNSQGEHLMESPCQTCHLAEKVDSKNGSMLIASQEKLCISCHANAVRLSHPSGILPKRALPPQFPLDWKGTLTCSSCHTIHGSGAGLMRSTQRGAEFCHKCHDPQFFERMADKGDSVTASGHLDARQQRDNWDLPLDPFTLQCLGCHSEQAGGDRRVGLGNDGVLRHTSSSMNHPIGRNYEETAKQGGYHPINRLPPEIVLPDGKVGCISCHEGYSERHGKLVKANAGSALCFTCHDL